MADFTSAVIKGAAIGQDMEPMFVPEWNLLASYHGFDDGKYQGPKDILPPPGLEYMGNMNDQNVPLNDVVKIVTDFSTLPPEVASKEFSNDVVKIFSDFSNLPPEVASKEISKVSSLPAVAENPFVGLVGMGKMDREGKGMRDWIAQHVAMMSRKRQHSKTRWWTSSKLVCPLSNFPICLLPYPPFKLHMLPGKMGPHKWVDGKFLALMVITSGQMSACGRDLNLADAEALDEYIHRCKLGTFRTESAWKCAIEASSPNISEEDRQKSAIELNKLRSLARTEFGRLRGIQQRRLVRFCQGIASGDHMSAVHNEDLSPEAYAVEYENRSWP